MRMLTEQLQESRRWLAEIITLRTNTASFEIRRSEWRRYGIIDILCGHKSISVREERAINYKNLV